MRDLNTDTFAEQQQQRARTTCIFSFTGGIALLWIAPRYSDMVQCRILNRKSLYRIGKVFIRKTAFYNVAYYQLQLYQQTYMSRQLTESLTTPADELQQRWHRP